MTTTTRNEKFDRLLHLDRAVRCSFAQVVFGTPGKEESLEADRQRFYAALDDLTPDEVVAFREYRRAIREEM